MSIFELSEKPQLENVDELEKSTITPHNEVEIEGKSPILKIVLSGVAYYHFRSVEIDHKIVNMKSYVCIGGKTFYKATKDIKIHSRKNLKNL
jgi:hypothetical protein